MVFPLSGHDLSVGSGDLDTGVYHVLVGIQLKTIVWVVNSGNWMTSGRLKTLEIAVKAHLDYFP